MATKVAKDVEWVTPVPFQIYADFEGILESVERCEGFYSKKYQDHILYRFLFVILSKPTIS